MPLKPSRGRKTINRFPGWPRREALFVAIRPPPSWIPFRMERTKCLQFAYKGNRTGRIFIGNVAETRIFDNEIKKGTKIAYAQLLTRNPIEMLVTLQSMLSRDKLELFAKMGAGHVRFFSRNPVLVNRVLRQWPFTGQEVDEDSWAYPLFSKRDLELEKKGVRPHKYANRSLWTFDLDLNHYFNGFLTKSRSEQQQILEQRRRIVEYMKTGPLPPLSGWVPDRVNGWRKRPTKRPRPGTGNNVWKVVPPSWGRRRKNSTE